MNAPKLIHSVLLFQQCGVMSIPNEATFRIVRSVFESLNGLILDYMKDMFEIVTDVSVKSTRLSATNNVYVSNRTLCVSRRALR